MATYRVTIKNISVGVSKMALPKGDTATIKVRAEDRHHAIQVATRRLFDNCYFHSEGKYGDDGTLIGLAVFGGSVYGRMWVNAG